MPPPAGSLNFDDANLRRSAPQAAVTASAKVERALKTCSVTRSPRASAGGGQAARGQ